MRPDRYAFTDPETRARTGRWWDRELVGTDDGPASLDDPRLGPTIDRLGLCLPGDSE